MSAATARRPTAARMFTEFAGSRVAVAAITTLNVAVITREAPVAVYGVYAAATSYAVLLFTFLDLGNAQVLVREAARGDRDAAVRTYLHVRALLTAVTLGLGAVGAILLFDGDGRATALIGLGLVLASGPGLLAPIGQVTGDLAPWRATVLLQALLTFVGTATVLFVLDREEPEALMIGAVAGAGVATAYGLARIWPWARRIASALDVPQVRRQLRSVALLGSAVVLAAVYYRIDGVLLLRLDGAEQSAYYGLAYRILDQARVIPTALLIPLGPLIASRLGAGVFPGALDRQLRRLGLWGGLGLAAGVMCAADLIVTVVSGSGYEESARLAVVLAAALAVIIAGQPVVLKVIMAKLERQYALVAAFGVALNVALNLALIPPFRAMGAAVATVATEALVLLVLVWVGRAHSSVRWAPTLLLLIVAGAALAGAKIGAMEAGIAVNLPVSAALAGFGIWASLKSYRELKGLPAPHADERSGADALA